MKYLVTVYPNVESDEYTIEADSEEEAIKIAEEKARMNCYFMATKDDVEPLEEDD